MHEPYRPPGAPGRRARSTTTAPGRPGRALRGRAAAPALLGIVLVLTAGACGTDGAGPVADAPIEREVFIQAYVDLRAAALRTDSQRIAEADRAEILSRHGVTARNLLDFVELNSDRLEYMRDLWNEVEVRLEAESIGDQGG